MRDSSSEEIFTLKRLAPVVTIDDCGPGRVAANLAVDLLPNQPYQSSHQKFSDTSFIFGYNFSYPISLLPSDIIEKDIDICIYAGNNVSDAHLAYFTSLIPQKCNAVFVGGRNNYYLQNGILENGAFSYPLPLLRSKILITHFGVTVYEGLLSGCKVRTINPTSYHNSLADIAAPLTGLVNYGISGSIDPEMAKSDMLSALNGEIPSVHSTVLNTKIQMYTDRFIAQLGNLLS